jgi:hypothetical protein
MIIVEAEVQVRPLLDETFDHFVDVYGNGILPKLRPHGMDHIGGFKRAGADTMNDLINLYRFDSFADYEKARASFRADPAVLAEMGKLQGASVKEIVKIVEPAAYWQPETLEAALQPRDTPRYYLQAVLQAGALSRHPRFMDVMGRLRDAVKDFAMDLTLAYETQAGVRGEVTDLWAMPAPFGVEYRPTQEGPLSGVIREIREYAPEERLYYLYPLPYSRMQ